MSDRAFIALLGLLIAWGLYLLRPMPETPPDARIAQLEAKVASLQLELDSRKATSDSAVKKVATRKQSLQVGDTVIRLGVKSAQRILSDTAASPDTLRAVLARTVEKIERYQGEVLRYQESVDSLLMAHLRERQAFTAQIDTLNALVDAHAPTPCTYFGVRCPSRGASFVIGVAVALALVVVL